MLDSDLSMVDSVIHLSNITQSRILTSYICLHVIKAKFKKNSKLYLTLK